MFAKITLKSKVLLLVIVITASMSSIALLGLHALKIASEQDNIARIEQLFKSTYSAIVQLERLTVSGKLQETQAKMIAASILQENKYHDSEYVYVVDESLDFIAAPHDPQLVGTSFNDFKDAKGNSIGALVERVAMRGNGQMVNYDWTSKRDGEVVELTSVVQRTPGWGWYVGTGISFKEVDERYWSIARWLVGLSTLIAIGIAFYLYYFGTRLQQDLGAEIKQVVSTVSRVSKGDLKDDSFDFDFRPDSIMGSITYMRKALTDVVTNINGVSRVLKEQVKDSEEQSLHLDKLTGSLNSETETVARSIEEIATTAQKVNEDVASTAVAINAAKQKGDEASELTQESTTTITELERQIEKAGESIHVLGEEVQGIEGVLHVIQGVAEQTNLLALNAAIEAARAGEQGRGFAVVADEVRNLAKRTSESTQEIHNMIERLQKVARDAIDSVETSIKTSEHSVSCSSQVREALDEMFTLIEDSAQKSQNIAVASQQQLQLAELANLRISDISKMSRDTAQVSRSAHDKADLIRQSSEELQSEMKKFQI
ncbi:methyl-accepting chemotaxis protein [Planctobacterium marinum]|uniref:methyl-accepting chemotaxis protein n=1 Tax=Planctobacterium marinum TaxID=1631968 RepID=UPI001E561C47|nr:methyl-accepting chemotaxis protein [Planctobacterium marinum]MCC2604214.1 methyl-accepting chemotaxis protein [Planctobacterium marinum]